MVRRKGEAMIAVAQTLPTSEDFAALVATLDSLDDRLALRTFLDGRDITVVDWLVWGAIRGENPAFAARHLIIDLIRLFETAWNNEERKACAPPQMVLLHRDTSDDRIRFG